MIYPLQMRGEKHTFNSPNVPKTQTQFLVPGKQRRTSEECYTGNRNVRCKCLADHHVLLHQTYTHVNIPATFSRSKIVQSPQFYLSPLIFFHQNIRKEIICLSKGEYKHSNSNLERYWTYIYWLIKYIVKPERHSNI